MSDDWDFYSLLVDSSPASIMVDLDLFETAPSKLFPKMGYIRVYMNDPRPDGLSSQEEFQKLIDLEKAIESRISTADDILYVGRNTSSGNRDFYFYLRRVETHTELTEFIQSSFPDYNFDSDVRDDKDWSTYLGFLYPSPRDMQRIMDRRVCYSLEDAGDDLEVVREIDHMAFLNDKVSLETFKNFLIVNGYSIRKVPKEKLWSKQYTVDFFREDAPMDIENVAIPLFEKITELGGVYDGWGCSVIGSKGQ